MYAQMEEKILLYCPYPSLGMLEFCLTRLRTNLRHASISFHQWCTLLITMHLVTDPTMICTGHTVGGFHPLTVVEELNILHASWPDTASAMSSDMRIPKGGDTELQRVILNCN